MSTGMEAGLATYQIAWLADEYELLNKTAHQPHIAGSIEDYRRNRPMDELQRQKEGELVTCTSPETPDLRAGVYNSPKAVLKTMLDAGMPEGSWVGGDTGGYVLIEHRSSDDGEEYLPVLRRANGRAVRRGVSRGNVGRRHRVQRVLSSAGTVRRCFAHRGHSLWARLLVSPLPSFEMGRVRGPANLGACLAGSRTRRLFSSVCHRTPLQIPHRPSQWQIKEAELCTETKNDQRMATKRDHRE